MRPPASDDLPTVAVAHGLVEATLAVSMLEAAGIPVIPASRYTVSVAWGWTDALGGIALQVPRAQVEAAREILAGFTPQHRPRRLIHIAGFLLAFILVQVPPPSSGFFVVRMPEAARPHARKTP